MPLGNGNAINCFSNLERLKEDAEWVEDTQSWILPELTRIKLPPASGEYRKGIHFYESHHIVVDFDGCIGASRQSVNSLTAPARLENSENSLAIFYPVQVIVI